MAIIVSKNVQFAAVGKNALGAFSTVLNTSIVGPITDFAPANTFEQYERETQSQFAGKEASVLGSVLGAVGFNVPFRGSGTAGVINDLDALLLGCGHVKRVAPGTAAIGAVVPFPSVGHAGLPTLTGTFAGTISGRVVITITALVVNTSIAFLAVFYPGDGTAPTAYTGTQEEEDAIVLSGGPLDTLAVDFGNPDVATAPFVVGDQFRVSLRSSSAVNIEYLPSPTPSQFGANGPKLVDLQAIIDNVDRHRFKSCSGTFTITGNRAETIIFGFSFTGEYVRPDAATYIANAVYSDIIPPAVKAATATWDAQVLSCFSTFSFDPAAVVNALDCAGAAQGYDGAYVSAFDPVFTLDVEQSTLTTWNPFAAIESNSQEALSFSIGTAGNRMTIIAESAQLVDCQPGERNGRAIWNLTFRFRRRSDAALNDPNVPYLIRLD